MLNNANTAAATAIYFLKNTAENEKCLERKIILSRREDSMSILFSCSHFGPSSAVSPASSFLASSVSLQPCSAARDNLVASVRAMVQDPKVAVSVQTARAPAAPIEGLALGST